MSKTSRIEAAKRLLATGAVHPRGCSDFVSACLGVAWASANELMGDAPTEVGANGKYDGLEPGDVVGWKRAEASGHVAIYVGDEGSKPLIDVRSPGDRPRALSSYGAQVLFKSSKY